MEADLDKSRGLQLTRGSSSVNTGPSESARWKPAAAGQTVGTGVGQGPDCARSSRPSKELGVFLGVAGNGECWLDWGLGGDTASLVKDSLEDEGWRPRESRLGIQEQKRGVGRGGERRWQRSHMLRPKRR